MPSALCTCDTFHARIDRLDGSSARAVSWAQWSQLDPCRYWTHAPSTRHPVVVGICHSIGPRSPCTPTTSHLCASDYSDRIEPRRHRLPRGTRPIPARTYTCCTGPRWTLQRVAREDRGRVATARRSGFSRGGPGSRCRPWGVVRHRTSWHLRSEQAGADPETRTGATRFGPDTALARRTYRTIGTS